MAKLSSTQVFGDLKVDGEIKNKATTSTEGVVQLNDAVNSSSTTQGATANAVKKVQDGVNSHTTNTTSHITAGERTTWNGKASTAVATTTANGLMSKDDKSNLDKIPVAVDGVLKLMKETNNFNMAFIEGTRNGVIISELWLLINATYDPKTKRFKRVNLDNFSFGWQMSADGTYPGEENFGDMINQGMNLWKANGKKAYQGNDQWSIDMRNKTGEDIGEMVNSEWQSFGTMLGWQNHFMCDSYGGMTIGGKGFEIDGSGTTPYSRVSHGTAWDGTAGRVGYTGTTLNLFHGFFDRDDRTKEGYYYGFVSDIIAGTNTMDTSTTRFSIMKMDANASHTKENMKEMFSIGNDGAVRINGDVEIKSAGKNFIAPNNYGYKGRTTDGGSDYMLWMNTANQVNVGFSNRQVKIDCANPVQQDGHTLYHAGNKPPNSSINPAYIPANSNLNSYTGAGFYYSDTNANSGTLVNTPFGAVAFSLIVLRNAGCTQIATTYANNDERISIRNEYAGAWGAWRELITNNLIGGAWTSNGYMIPNQNAVYGFTTSTFMSKGENGLGASCVGISDWNNALKNGFYMGSGCANAPSSNWWMGYVLNHHDGWVVQMVNEFSGSGAWMQRHKLNGTWQPWRTLGGGGSGGRYVRATTMSTGNPSGGGDGDIWVKYS